MLCNKPEEMPFREWRIHTGTHNIQRYTRVNLSVYGKVLDVGCGSGFASCVMTADSVLGIDIREESLEMARELAKLNQVEHVTFELGDAYNLAFEDKSFDVVCLLEILEHLEDPKRAVEEAVRVGNRVIVTVPAHGFMTHTPGHINDFTTEEILNMLPGAEHIVKEPFLFVVWS